MFSSSPTTKWFDAAHSRHQWPTAVAFNMNLMKLVWVLWNLALKVLPLFFFGSDIYDLEKFFLHFQEHDDHNPHCKLMN